MNLIALCGLSSAVGALLFGMLAGAPLGIFFDLPSAVLVIGGSGLILILRHGGRRGLGVIFGGLARLVVPSALSEWRAEQWAHAAVVAASGRSAALCCGGLGAAVGLVQNVINAADPAAIGPAMALSLISTLYALVLALFCFMPLVHHREH
jgi:flagellar motor component MotA